MPPPNGPRPPSPAPPAAPAPPPPAARRRTIRKAASLIILLIAGATLNVAVAWGFFLASTPLAVNHNGMLSMRQQDPIFWRYASKQQVGSLMLDAISWRSKQPWEKPQPPRWSAMHSPPTQRDQSLREAAFGWPSLALYSMDTAPWPAQSWGRPLNPIFPGFAINTLFYAGVLWVLCCGPFALRRMIRRRRGQCPACAYPIGQSPVCTECGAAVMPN